MSRRNREFDAFIGLNASDIADNCATIHQANLSIGEADGMIKMVETIEKKLGVKVSSPQYMATLKEAREHWFKIRGVARGSLHEMHQFLRLKCQVDERKDNSSPSMEFEALSKFAPLLGLKPEDVEAKRRESITGGASKMLCDLNNAWDEAESHGAGRDVPDEEWEIFEEEPSPAPPVESQTKVE